jgi:shikimate dehydrogenase
MKTSSRNPRYLVIGNPIAQSKGPEVFAMFAKQTGHMIDYTKIEANVESNVESKIDGFAAAIDQFRAEGGCGINVTAPFKLKAFAYATQMSENARLAGAVNAMKFDGAKVSAENFDGIGLVRDITHNLGFSIKAKRILILGAGGAARGAILPLLKQSPDSIIVADVSNEAAKNLESLFGGYGSVKASSYAALIDQKFDLVINATSASLRGELPPVPASVFDLDCMAYEMAYGKGLTPFLRLAKNTGVRLLADGIGMMVEQAAEAFDWWCGVRPKTHDVIAQHSAPLK